MKNIVWGMIGCGDVTEVKNGPGLYLSKHSVLKGITNRTLSKAHDWVNRHQQGQVYSDIQELLNDAEIDIVYIAVTPDLHMEYAIQCAQAGKHCLIEKPLAMDYEQGLKIKEAFDKAGKKAFVAFYRRSLNRFNKIKEFIDSGEIGGIEAINIARYVKPIKDEAQWRAQPHISGGNVFTETDIHILDFVDYIMGEIDDYCFTKNIYDKTSTSFDCLSLSMKFKNGCIGSGHWLYNCTTEMDRFEIIGEKGLIQFDFFNNLSPIYVIHEKQRQEYSVSDSKHVGYNMEQQIVNELNGSGNFSGTLDAALRTLKMTDKIYKGSNLT